jgi:WD40-like Beta Propeller Repeat
MSVSVDSRSFRGLLAWVVSAVFAVVLLVVLGGSVSGAWASGCPNEAFRTGPSAALPDCRAYEMVSPPNKNGGQVDNSLHFGENVAPEQAAADGEAVTYGSASAFLESEATSALVSSQYISSRTADGWVTREITPVQQIPGGRVPTYHGAPDFDLFQGFSEDLDYGFLLAWNPQPDPLAPAGYFNPYLRDDATGGYQLLSSVVPEDHSPRQKVTLTGPGFYSLYAGMSADGQHVIFAANEALVPGALPGQLNLYEWSAGRGLELVSLPEVSGEGYENELEFGSPTEGPASLENQAGDGGDGSEGFPYNFSGALSSDGMRAFWTGSNHQVYMHEIVGSGSRTVEVSASQKSGQPSEGAGAQYWTANSEGSLVYLTSSGQLTADSTAGPGQDPKEPGQDLYQYNADTGELSDLTVDHNPGETATVKGVLGMGESEGGQYVYFTAGGVLAANANSDGEKAATQTCQSKTYHNESEASTPCNLYLYHDGQTTFIATLGGAAEAELSDDTEAVMARTARVSPDGKLLAFQSERPLTGYDSLPANGQACPEPLREGEYETESEARAAGDKDATYNNVGCLEVFEYDAQTGKLVCASCNPSGLPPAGDSMLPETYHEILNVTGWESSTVQQRYLLDDGRLFFQSEDALLPQATNGKLNIYEYEPEGTGQCAASGGGSCLYLISTGESSGDSYFADASTDGRDVFFLTSQQLVPADGDEAIDMYDAREDGGFASATPAPCSGEACKPAVTPAPAIYGAPSSATFQGAGDIPVTPAVAPTSKTAKKKPKKKVPVKKTKRSKGKAGKKQRVGRGARRSGRSVVRFEGGVR